MICVGSIGCAPFDDPIGIGPPGGVLGRPDGPAATLATLASGTVAVFATADGSAALLAELPRDGAVEKRTPTVLSDDSSWRRHPPVALPTQEGQLLVAWRETRPGEPGRMMWIETDASASSLPNPEPLPAAFGSRPEIGGTPPSLTAVEGDPGGPRAGRVRELGVWQRAPAAEGGWIRLGTPLKGLPRLYAATGLGPEIALTALVDDTGALRFVRSGIDGGRTSMVVRGRPSGPRPVWLAAAGEAVVAGWSETVGGRGGYSAVRTSRSSDGGVTWDKPLDLGRSRFLEPQLASFASRGSTIVVAWNASDGVIDRIFLAVSHDGGASFSPRRAVDGGTPARERRRVRVALAGDRALIAWQERGRNEPAAVYASFFESLDAEPTIRAERLAEAAPGHAVRNPQPWLSTEGGGVLWESLPAPESPQAPATAAPPVLLRARTLRR